VRRREFITLVGGAAAGWPLAARAQQPGERVRRVGALLETTEDDKERNSQFAKFREGLASFGWVEGRTVHIENRFAAADPGRYQPLARELVALDPEVILTVSTPVTAALQRETNAIPIVFVGVSDPIGSGFAANLARPGSNLTGIMLFEVGIAGKWLAMLKEIAPRLTRVALVAGPKTTATITSSGMRRPQGRRSASRLFQLRSLARRTSNTESRRSRACRTAAFCCRRTARPWSIVIS
jgi:putative ABC transport system substrate-binding protein